MTTANWTAIRQEYEQGDSLRVLAARHGVGVTTIHDRSKSEHWVRTLGERKTNTERPPIPTDDAFSLARYALHKLIELAQGDLDLKDHKLLSDALSQYNKVIAAAPPQPTSQSSYIAPELIAVMTPQEQDMVQKILSEAEQRLGEKVTPIRRQA